MTLPTVGTIVRLPANGGENEEWAVVIPNDWVEKFAVSHTYATTRVLEKSVRNGGDQYWYLVDPTYPWTVVPDDEVPEDIWVLAGRSLLDPDFKPEWS